MNGFITLLLLATLLLVTLALIIFHRVKVPGARYFSLLLLAVAIWSVSYATELNTKDLQVMVFWASFAYFGILLVPVLWFSFSLAYTGHEALLTRSTLIMLAVEPVLMIILVWSNPVHHLFYSQVDAVTSSLGTAAFYSHGPIFWVNAVYTYVLLFIGSFVLIRSLFANRNPIRGQVIALLGAILAPWIGNALYLSGYNPLPPFDLTPLAFIFTGLAVSWALLRYRLLDIMPVAHAALIANLQDGLIVLDSRKRIVEINPAAEAIFSLSASAYIGHDAEELAWGSSELLPLLMEDPETHLEIAIGQGEGERHYDVRSTALKDRLGSDNGRLIVLRDVSERVKADQTLDRSEMILEAVSFAATKFLSTASWEDSILEVLKHFGEAAGVSRAYILENHPAPEAALCANQHYEWVKEGFDLQIGEPKLADFCYREAGLARWEEMLRSNQVIYGPLNSFPIGEQAFFADQVKSIALAAIFTGETWWGCIGLDEYTFQRQWTKGEIDALQAAAGVIGSGIQRQKIEQALRQRAEELTALHEISLVINSPSELNELLSAIVERAMTLLGGTAGGLYLCDPEKLELQCVISTNTARDFRGVRLKYGEGAAGIVAQTGQPLIIDDYRTWEGRARVFEVERPFRSVLSAPMVWQEQVLGVIDILHDQEPQHFSVDNLTLLTLFANQAAITLHNAQAYAQAQHKAQRVAMLNDITQASIRAPNLDAMLHVLVERLSLLFGADDAYITFWDEEHCAAVPVASCGSMSDVYANIRPIAGEVTMTSSVLTAGRVLVAEDVFRSPYMSPRIAALFPARSMMGLPLIADGKKLGATLIGYNATHHFTRDEIDLAEEVSSQISLAMTKIRLLDLERRRANELEALQATFANVLNELDLPILLSTILERATSLLNATGGDLGLMDDSKNDVVIVVSHNMGKDYTGTRMAHGEGAMGRAIETGQPVVIADYQKWEGRSPQYTDIPYHAVLAVPLQVRGRIVGVLGVVDRNPKRVFTPDDQSLLHLFSQQAAAAIENAHLYTREKRRATELGLLFESSAAMVKTLDLARVYNIATERLAQAVDATSARILTCDLESGQATVEVEYTSPQACQQEFVSDVGVTYDLRDFPKTLAYLRSGKPQTLLISDPDLNPGDKREMMDYGVKSSLNLPMIASDLVIGYAEIWDSRTERIWSEEEIQFCQTLANQAALVIDNARLYNQMQRLAVTDTLTGTYNRRGLFENGQREINRALRSSRPLAAIMLDIDHFKQINDTHSHAVGDEVLQALAGLCRENLREMDIVGRYGGEEFAILLPETDIDSAYVVAQRLHQAVSETPVITRNRAIRLTISLGVACTQGEVTSLAVLLDQADTAMYKAKRAGRNMVRLYQSQDEDDEKYKQVFGSTGSFTALTGASSRMKME